MGNTKSNTKYTEIKQKSTVVDNKDVKTDKDNKVAEDMIDKNNLTAFQYEKIASTFGDKGGRITFPNGAIVKAYPDKKLALKYYKEAANMGSNLSQRILAINYEGYRSYFGDHLKIDY